MKKTFFCANTSVSENVSGILNLVLKKITVVLLVLWLLMPSSLYSQDSKAKVNWVSLEEAEVLMKKEPRKIFIDFYTDWCGWCKRMDAQTFSHPTIAAYLNTHFYAVKIDAEQSEPITFKGHKYINPNPGQRRSTHEFAQAVASVKRADGRNSLGYPTVVFIDEDLNVITPLPGFRAAKDFEAVLAFFKEDVYKHNQNLQQYIQQFQGEITE